MEFYLTFFLIFVIKISCEISVEVEPYDELPDTGGGKNPNDELLVKFLFLLPIVPYCYVIILYHCAGLKKKRSEK